MKFVHDDPEFRELVGIVASERGLSLGLVEKDYWVTHSLWALHEAGFDVWFKGGTSLSKGFQLIQRFSEDLDLKVEAGTVEALPRVSSWDKDGAKVTAERQAFFEGIPKALTVPGASLSAAQPNRPKWKGADIHVAYNGHYLDKLDPVMSPSVKLEMGDARVTPFLPRDLTSFVHEKLETLGQLGDFTDNRCKNVRCVHPLVTLMEKLDAIQNKCLRADTEPAKFVRHFEDAARIITGDLPTLADYGSVRALADEMREQKQIKKIPIATAPEFVPEASDRWNAIQGAHLAIGPMFWGERIPIEDACVTIRGWVAKELG